MVFSGGYLYFQVPVCRRNPRHRVYLHCCVFPTLPNGLGEEEHQGNEVLQGHGCPARPRVSLSDRPSRVCTASESHSPGSALVATDAVSPHCKGTFSPGLGGQAVRSESSVPSHTGTRCSASGPQSPVVDVSVVNACMPFYPSHLSI